MRENYNNLCIFNFGKRSYVVMKNNEKVLYFESVNGKYVMPVTSFNLYDNAGKSLTVVNQHFFMNQLVNRINIALNKGYLTSDKEIIEYLINIKSNIESDVTLKNLFKGSLMGEINEDNYEHNKKELLKYLDKFKLDTFVDYNSVSVFNGSLDKNSEDNSNNILMNNVSTINSNQEVNNIELFNFTDTSKFDSSEVINSSDYFSSIADKTNNNSIDNNVSNSEPVDIIDEIDIIDDSDSNTLEPVNNMPENISNIAPIKSLEIVANKIDSSNSTISQNITNNIIEQNNLINIDDGFDEILSSIGSNNLAKNVTNYNLNSLDYQNDTSNKDVNYNNSYIDEVKNRIQNKTEIVNNYSNEIGNENPTFEPNTNVNLKEKVISDKNELPELDNISEEVTNTDIKKKSKAGIVLFIILLIIVLLAAFYILYFYVF